MHAKHFLLHLCLLFVVFLSCKLEWELQTGSKWSKLRIEPVKLSKLDRLISISYVSTFWFETHEPSSAAKEFPQVQAVCFDPRCTLIDLSHPFIFLFQVTF